MPQLQLPIFIEGVTQITLDLGYSEKDGQIIYYNGTLPIFRLFVDFYGDRAGELD